MTARRWWLLLGSIVSIEAGCLAGVWWLTRQDVSA